MSRHSLSRWLSRTPHITPSHWWHAALQCYKILAKLSESPWRPDTRAGRLGCGEIIHACTFDWNYGLFPASITAFMPTKGRCWLGSVSNWWQLQINIYIPSRWYVVIVWCGMSSFINIGSLSLASINQTQYYDPATRKLSCCQNTSKMPLLRLALTWDSMMMWSLMSPPKRK